MTAEISPQTLRTTASVLDCALHLFAQHGTCGLAMSTLSHRIATETGTDPARVRRAFPTRFDLVYAVVLRSVRERVTAQLNCDSPDTPATERMSALVRRHVETGWEHRTATALGYELFPLLRAIDPARHRELSSLLRGYREHIRAIVVSGVADGLFTVGDPGRAADDVLETCDSLLHWYTPDDSLSLADLGAVYVDLVIHHHLGCPR